MLAVSSADLLGFHLLRTTPIVSIFMLFSPESAGFPSKHLKLLAPYHPSKKVCAAGPRLVGLKSPTGPESTRIAENIPSTKSHSEGVWRTDQESDGFIPQR